MNWESLKSNFEGLQTRGENLQQKIRGLRRRLTLLLAVVGPGLITSNVDNDAGGIATYTQAGAQYGYALLWSLIPMTIALYVTEEMCARMGVITGKGLSDLIREEFGFRPTFFVMVTGFFRGLGERRGGIRRRGCVHGDVSRQQVHRGSHRGAFWFGCSCFAVPIVRSRSFS